MVYKDADKIKYLELIENNIMRFSNISTIIKGWFVTIFVATFPLYINVLKSEWIFYLCFVSVVALVLVYLFDTYFLYQEKLYRVLYDRVRKDKVCNSEYFDLNPMSFMKCTNRCCVIIKALRSYPQVLFYGTFFIVFIAIWIKLLYTGTYL